MADIKVQRSHALGMEKARSLAREWMEGDAKKLGLNCTLKPGETQDVIEFERMGATGQMNVSADTFELEIKLGMMAPLKSLVESEIEKILAGILAKAEGGTPKA